MSEAVVAKRYADALFQLADEKKIVDQTISELEIVKDVFQANDSLIDLFNHPRIQSDEKMKLIDDAFGQCDKYVVNMLKILVERHRIEYITDIIQHFTALFHEAKGEAVATVYSVRALSDDEKSNIETSLIKQLDKQKVSINNVVDSSVIGGMKIRIGNTIYDGSISGKLNRIKNNIVSVSN